MIVVVEREELGEMRWDGNILELRTLILGKGDGKLFELQAEGCDDDDVGAKEELRRSSAFAERVTATDVICAKLQRACSNNNLEGKTQVLRPSNQSHLRFGARPGCASLLFGNHFAPTQLVTSYRWRTS